MGIVTVPPSCHGFDHLHRWSVAICHGVGLGGARQGMLAVVIAGAAGELG